MPSGELPIQTSPLGDLPGSPPAPLLGFLGNAIHGTVGYFSSGWPVAYLMATVIFGLGLLVGSSCTCPSRYRLPSNPYSPLPSGEGPGVRAART